MWPCSLSLREQRRQCTRPLSHHRPSHFISALTLHTLSHKALSTTSTLRPLAKYIGTPIQSLLPHTCPRAPRHRLLGHIPQPCPSHTALHPKTWPFLVPASSHPHTCPFPSCSTGLRPLCLRPLDKAKPMGSSFTPPVSPFTHQCPSALPHTNETICNRFLFPGNANRGQSQGGTLMFQELNFEQGGDSQGPWPQGREGGWW